METVREYIRRCKEEDIQIELENLKLEISSNGYLLEFGKIGEKTNYALIYTEDHSEEYVGYTYVRNLKYYHQTLGELKALQQAIARKETLQSGRDCR